MRIRPEHRWLYERGWVRVPDLRIGNRVIAQWTHANHAGAHTTGEAETKQVYRERREAYAANKGIEG